MAIQTYELAYQVSPLILTGGITMQSPGSMMPFLAFADSAAFSALTVAGAANTGLGSLDDAFGAFQVIQGGSLVRNSIAKYPFANQYVAANAIIREPLELSVIWQTPMRGPGAWLVKQATMQALKATLDSHNNAGGTYSFVTPSYIYTNLVMTGLIDNSRPDVALPQNAWRFDFESPLISLQQLHSALSQLMSSLTNGTPTTGAVSGAGSSIGAVASQPQSLGSTVASGPVASTAGLVSGVPGQTITATFPGLGGTTQSGTADFTTP